MSARCTEVETTTILTVDEREETAMPSSEKAAERDLRSLASLELQTQDAHHHEVATGGKRFDRALEVGVVVFCLTQSIGLVEAWVYSPFDFLGWVAFLIWLSPLLYQRWASRESNVSNVLQNSNVSDVSNVSNVSNVSRVSRVLPDAFTPTVAYRAAILLSLAAIMTDLRLLGYFGLAAALVGWSFRDVACETNRRRVTLVLLTTALAWMPLLGWIISPLLGFYTFVARLMLATIGAATTFSLRRRTLHHPS